MKSKKAYLVILVFISAKAFAFLPSGKIENYSFKEQSLLHNYKITGNFGFVSHLNHIFSAEKATIVVYNKNSNQIKKELRCDEITYELDNSYIQCVQGLKYLSLDLKID